MLKTIFTFLTEPLGLPIEWYYEWGILAILGFAAYVIAYGLVGSLYVNDDIYGIVSGKVMHWTIRSVIFAILWAIMYGIIFLIKKFIEHRIIVLSVLGGIFLILTIFLGIQYFRNRKKQKKDLGAKE